MDFQGLVLTVEKLGKRVDVFQDTSGFHPMVLMDMNDNNNVIASFSVAPQTSGGSFMTKRTNDTFQAVIQKDEQTFAFRVTNLSDQRIAFDLRHGQDKSGRGHRVNKVNIIDPKENTLIVASDFSNDEREMFLNILKDNGSSSSGVSVASAEAEQKGTYFTLWIYPTRPGSSFKNAVWHCPDFVAREQRSLPFTFNDTAWFIPRNNFDNFAGRGGGWGGGGGSCGWGGGGGNPEDAPPTGGSTDPWAYRRQPPSFGRFGENFSGGGGGFGGGENFGGGGGGLGFGSPAVPTPVGQPFRFGSSAPIPTSALALASSPVNPTASIPLAFDPGNDSFATVLRHGESRVNANTQEVHNCDVLYKESSAPVSICLSVLNPAKVHFMPKITTDVTRGALECAACYFEDGNKRLLQLVTQEFPEQECVICLSNVPELLFVKCGHKAACKACGERSIVDKCPLCRAPILAKIEK
jgi:hypothetical protein